MAINKPDPDKIERRLAARRQWNKERRRQKNANEQNDSNKNLNDENSNMPQLAKFSIRKSSHEYELALRWDDNALMEGKVSFTVTALRRDIATHKIEEKIEATVSIEEDESKQPILKISDGRELEVIFPLRELFEESQIIDQIPAWFFGGDPSLGCLIRSGLSTTVAQIIECKNQTAGVPWFIERCRAMGNVLLTAIPDMTAKMVRRVIRCILRMGL